MAREILVTGGAGFIGSHTCKHLAEAGYKPIVFDNLSTGHEDSVVFGPLARGDIRNPADLDAAFEAHRPEAVIHFAACAYVGESMGDPAKYYDNNVVGTLRLVEAMRRHRVDRIVFSSSCATYGVPDRLPISEAAPQRPINPYGMTKFVGEAILHDFAQAYGLRVASLRYFNASGADLDGRLRERHDPETHLIPRALMAATGRLPRLEVFGTDYDTADGTCVRDYIHVEDLAVGHLRGLDFLARGEALGFQPFNLGTGRGLSVRQILEAIKAVTGCDVPVAYEARRDGDPPTLYADPQRARAILGFEATRSDVDTIVRSALPQFEMTAR